MAALLSSNTASASTDKLDWQIVEDCDGLTVAHTQNIPASWTSWIAEERKASWENRNNTEMIRVASLPVVFVHQWLREGYNVYQEDVKTTVTRIKTLGLTDFLTTEKNAF